MILLLFALMASPEPQTRSDVEKFLQSLKAAYDAGDRAKVMSHFQQSVATDAEYAMLGQIRFWDKPVGEIQTEGEVIRVTFTMAPEQFLTLNFIRAADGKLLVKSSAAPQANADLSQLLRERKKIERWPLLEKLVKEQATVLPADAQVFAFAEIYRGNEAMLMACASMSDALVPFAARFEKKDKDWVLQGRFAKEAEIDVMLHAPEAKKVRRQAGLPLDSLPQFFAYFLTDRARQFREALDRHDFKECAAIADEMMVGFSSDNAQVVLTTLGSPASASKVKLVSSTLQPDGRLLATFETDDKYGPSISKYFLAKEGNGWVIEERFSGPAMKTMSRIQELAVAMEMYMVEHDELFPQTASLEELRRLLQPRYLPAVPLTDAWRTPIRVEVSQDRKSYRLISAGADRKFNPQSWTVANQDLSDFAEDAVYEKGSFARQWRTSD